MASQRPRVRIKHLWLTADIWQGEEIVVNLGIVNNGTMQATLNTAGIRFVIVPNERPIPFDPHFPPVPGLDIAGRELKVGIWEEIQGIRNGTRLTDQENTAIHQGRSKLYCVGNVSYLDGANNMRITGFCRVLEFPAKALARTDNCRFRQFDDPDYEYQD